MTIKRGIPGDGQPAGATPEWAQKPGQEPARRPKERVIRPPSALKPGSPGAVRKGCHCPTSGLFVSPYCPIHGRAGK